MEKSKAISCPSCGFDNGLHHSEVEVFTRDSEDAESHRTIVDSDGNITTDSEGCNPSFRRDGLRVRLWCESCREVTYFCFAQHKGQERIWLEKLTPEPVSIMLEG